MNKRETLLREAFPNQQYELVKEYTMKNVYLVEDEDKILLVSVGDILNETMLQVDKYFKKEESLLKTVLEIHEFLYQCVSSETYATA